MLAIRCAVGGSTIELKTHTSRSDDENERWRNSGTSKLCRNSPLHTPQFTTISTRAAISTAAIYSNRTAPPRSPNGASSPRENLDHLGSASCRSVSLTKPQEGQGPFSSGLKGSPSGRAKTFVQNIEGAIHFVPVDDQGGVRVRILPIVTLKLSPFSSAAYMTASALSVAGVLASRSSTSSTPIRRPRPLTSPIRG